MTERRRIEHRLHTLAETRSIMNSMKTLALLETRKLARYLDNQEQVLRTFDDAGAEFLRFYSPPRSAPEQLEPIYLLFGSERGFNGDFNRRVLETFEEASREHAGNALVIGRKLSQELAGDARVIDELPGPGVAEEIEAAVDALVAGIRQATEHRGPLALIAVHHGAQRGEVETRTVFPPFRESDPHAANGYAPELNLTPARFFTALLEDYLVAVLHGLFFISLIAENQQRMEHLDSAVRRLDETREQLGRQQRTLRQEEITEEIEVILLSAEATAAPTGDRHHER